MGLLQPYRGRYASASSASNKIDAATILAGCDAVDNEAIMQRFQNMKTSREQL